MPQMIRTKTCAKGMQIKQRARWEQNLGFMWSRIRTGQWKPKNISQTLFFWTGTFVCDSEVSDVLLPCRAPPPLINNEIKAFQCVESCEKCVGRDSPCSLWPNWDKQPGPCL